MKCRQQLTLFTSVVLSTEKFPSQHSFFKFGIISEILTQEMVCVDKKVSMFRFFYNSGCLLYMIVTGRVMFIFIILYFQLLIAILYEQSNFCFPLKQF